MTKKALVCLDVGEKRIGVAVADTSIRIAVPLITITVDGNELKTIADIVATEGAKTIVLGYPRNQQGETTTQSEYVEAFAKQIEELADIVYQDESLTSVMAEDRLKQSGRPYQKADIDSHAAAIILQDYLEQYHG